MSTIPSSFEAVKEKLGFSSAQGNYSPLDGNTDTLKRSLLAQADEDEKKDFTERSSTASELSDYTDSSSQPGGILQEKVQLQPARDARSTLLNAVYIFLNVFSTIALTFLNKIVVQNDQLKHCQVSFAAFHFSMTFGVLYIASLPPFNLFPRARVPIRAILPLCILFNAFLILGNLSLEYNDVAFYTLARLMTCPTVVLLNYLIFRTKLSALSLFSVILLTLGVVVANGKLGLANPLGLILAVSAFVVTAMYQILIQRRIGELKVPPAQLLFNQAPVAMVLLLFIVPFFDTKPDLAVVEPHVWGALIASGLMAALFNISQFLIIGATSALTFNVMGMAKVVGNLTIGWTIAQRFPSGLEILGVGMAMTGTWVYASSTPKKKTVEKSITLVVDTPADDVERKG